jgi:hypothetical protein
VSDQSVHLQSGPFSGAFLIELDLLSGERLEGHAYEIICRTTLAQCHSFVTWTENTLSQSCFRVMQKTPFSTGVDAGTDAAKR